MELVKPDHLALDSIKKPFAEITESSVSSWQAQSWDWQICPELGSLMKIQLADLTIFGVVYHIKTGSNDPNRVVYPFGKTQEELLRDQPEIFEFLSTTFSCLTLGYVQNHKIYYHLAPRPPQIHSFVQEATNQELTCFFKSAQFLQVIFSLSHQLFSVDELLITMLKSLSQKSILNQSLLNDFVQTYSLLTTHEYSRLKLFLRRVQLLSSNS